MQNIWDWGILDGCFGDTKIKPTDLDGFIERKGKFLVIETKSPNVEVTKGQQITFDALINTGYFTVIVVWGEANKPEKIKLITSQAQKEYPGSIAKFREIVSRWYAWADN